MSNVRDHSMPVESVLPASDAEALYQLIKRAEINPTEVEDLAASTVEVTVLWRSAILHVAHLAPGASFTLSSVTPSLPSAAKRMAPGVAVGVAAMLAGAASAHGAAVFAGVGAAVTAASLGAGMHAHLRSERAHTDPTRFVVDAELLGADEVVVVEHRGAPRFVFLAGCDGEIEIDGSRRTLAELEAQGLARPSAAVAGAREVAFVPGGRYRMDLGGLSVVAKEVRAGRRVGAGGRRDPLLGRVALGTGVVMAALMGVVRLAVPDAGMLSSEDSDERLSLLRSAMERMQERAPEAPPPEPQQGAAAGAAHEGPAGAMGDRRSTDTGRYVIRRRDSAPSIARTRSEAARSGVLSLNLGVGGAPANGNVPTSPFGALEASGDGDRDANGRMDGDHIGDGGGYGGLDGVGTGWGGGGDGRDTIGVGGLNTLGHGGDCREGQDCDRGRRAAVTRMADRRTRFEVTARPPTVTPGVPPELIRRVVLRNISQVNRCYEQGLSVNPRAAGRVAVRFAITPDGSVLASSVADDTLGLPAVSQCIAGAVRRWSFTLPADSGTVTVTYPFSLMPADQ